MFKAFIVFLVIVILILAGIGATAVSFAIKNLLMFLAIASVVFLLVFYSFIDSDEEEDKEDN